MEIKLILYLTMLLMDPPTDEEEAQNFLDRVNQRRENRSARRAAAKWNYDTNITDANQQKKLEIFSELVKEEKQDWDEAQKFDWQNFKNHDLKRQFQMMSKRGRGGLPEDKYKELNKVISDMIKIHSTAKICPMGNHTECNLRLDPDLVDIFDNSDDPEQLEYFWLAWRRAVGPKCKPLYPRYVALVNEAARLDNLTDNSEAWLHTYEEPNLLAEIQELWEQVKPLYLQIHAYVRTRLRRKYGHLVPRYGPIPAHLLGHMWAQHWRSLFRFIKPYPGKESEDVTAELRRQNYTVEKMFKTAEDFFKSINLTAMPESFWKDSVLVKPPDREMVCHPSAWDFGNGKDFRIKMCAKVNLDNLITIHHEMGHIEYYLQYRDQPPLYRLGANHGFQEAIGDLISLSVQSRKHLRKIGLLQSTEDDPQTSLNKLFEMALDKVVFMPSAYVMDLWRYGVFRGEITPKTYNLKWWNLREKYQGIQPPVAPSRDNFDPAAKYHIIADVPYLRYFVAHVLQFQLHRSLCKIAGEYEEDNPEKPLHNCDIYGNTNAGNVLKEMLRMGASKHWRDVLAVVTGERKMDATAILEYFKPLHEWLVMENLKTRAAVGW